MDYDLLYLEDTYISLVFSAMVCLEGSCYYHDYLVTINIPDGKYMYLNDLADAGNVLRLVATGDFTFYEGTFHSGGSGAACQPEKLENYARIFKEEILLNISQGGYDCFSSQNIGLDDRYLYISFCSRDNDGNLSEEEAIFCISLKDLVF